jgi:hypothetical protein
MNVRTALIGTLGALVIGAALGGTAATTPAQAARVVIGVAAPATECVVYRKNRRSHKRFVYCDSPVWTGEPIIYEGVTYRDNLHFKVIGGKRHFWIKGRWVVIS